MKFKKFLHNLQKNKKFFITATAVSFLLIFILAAAGFIFYKVNAQNKAETKMQGSLPLVKLQSINQQYILKSISLGYEWFLNDANPKTKIFNYIYYPESNVYAKNISYGRQIAAVWATAELGNFLGREDYHEIAKKNIDHYLKYLKEKNGVYYMKIDNSRLAYSAFMLFALLQEKTYPEREKIMQQLADGILSLQRENGSFNTDFEKEIPENDESVNYYTGEAMLAITRLYNETGEEKYIQAIKKAFPYYVNYWRENQNTAFVPWHTQVYKLLYDKTRDEELADFVFEMNDWIVDNYQKFESDYADYVGGFGENPSNSSASYLEGLADAYYLAEKVGDKEHIEKYKKSCQYAARFVLQTQYKENSVKHLMEPKKALGGFKQSPKNSSLRVDYTQHSSLSLKKVYEYKIFK